MSPELDDLMFEHAVYSIKATDQDGEQGELLLTFGAPRLQNTFWPDGDYAPAIIRPMSLTGEREDLNVAALEIWQLYGDCDENRACAYGIAIDPATGLPFRIYMQPLEAVLSDAVQDGAARSLYFTERSDTGIWRLLPLFLSSPNALHAAIVDVFGEPVQVSSTMADDEVRVEFDAILRFHNSDDGTNATEHLAGQSVYSGTRELRRAILTMTGESYSISYSYALVENGQTVSVPAMEAATEPESGAIGGPGRCGDDLHAPLLPGADYRLDEAFSKVQQETAFINARARSAVLLMGFASEFKSPPAEGTHILYGFDVWQDNTTIRYEVEGPSSILGQTLDDDYTIVARREVGTPAIAPLLAASDCLGSDAAGKRIEQHVSAIGADGYFLSNIGYLPVDLAFRWQSGKATPVAASYIATIQPYLLDESGNRLGGPQMEFSLITGDLIKV